MRNEGRSFIYVPEDTRSECPRRPHTTIRSLGVANCLIKSAQKHGSVRALGPQLSRNSRLVPGGFAEMAAMVLAAFALAGFGVDGDALAVGPVAVFDGEGVAHGFEAGNGFRGEAWL